jgi:hypothetical protein
VLVDRRAGTRLVGGTRQAHLAGLAGKSKDHSGQIRM